MELALLVHRWYIRASLALRNLTQENCHEFPDHLGYTVQKKMREGRRDGGGKKEKRRGEVY